MRRWLDIYCFLAGVCDALTGVLLVTAPGATLALLGIATPGPQAAPETLFFVRWIGIFVGAVGLAYLYPLLLPTEERKRRQRPVLEITALVRAAVASFLAWQLGSGTLDPAWVTVMVTDLVLALFQIEILRRGLVPCSVP